MSGYYSHFWRMAPCLLVIIVDYMGLGLVYPIVTEMFTETPNVVFPSVDPSWRNFFMGLAYVLYPLFMFFGASLLGDLSDIYGRKKVLLLSVTGILVSFLVMSLGVWGHSLLLFLLGRAFSGLMAGSQPLCMAAIADLSTAETKAKNMSLVTLTNCVGLIFGPLIGGVFTGGYFLRTVGFIFPFLVAIFLALISLLLLFFLFRETFRVGEIKKIYVTRPITIFIDAFQSKKVRVLVWVLFLQMLGFMVYYQTSGIYLRETFAYSSEGLGFFYAYMGVFFALGVLVATPFALKKWHIEQIAAYSFLINGIAAFISTFYQQEFFLLAITIPFAASNSVGFTAMATVFSQCTDERRQGWIMGVVAATFSVSMIVSGFSTNVLSLLEPKGVILLGGISGILSGLLMIYYMKRHGIHKRGS